MDAYNESCIILEDKKKLNRKELDEKWMVFNQNYPKLYQQLITTENFNMEMLKFLCENVDKHKKMSENDQFELEVNIGKHLANQYIYTQTNLPKPTPQQEEFLKEKLKEKKLNAKDSIDNSDNSNNMDIID